MIGYMKPQRKKMPAEMRKTYNEFYCGLCRCLKHEYGISSTIILNFEIVNMLILSESLKNEPFERINMTCSITPMIWRKMCINSPGISAAARLSVILAYLETNDNLIDSNKFRDKVFVKFMEPKLNKIKKDFCDEFDYIKKYYDDYMALENMSKTDRDKITFDELVSSCGKIAGAMMDVIAFSESSPFRDQLRQIMNFWGEWVYLMDAVDDYDEDMKNGGFNPLFLAGSPCNIEKRIIDIEEKANAVLDVLAVLNNYELVDFLFRKSFCETREELFKKCRANRIEV